MVKFFWKQSPASALCNSQKVKLFLLQEVLHFHGNNQSFVTLEGVNKYIEKCWHEGNDWLTHNELCSSSRGVILTQLRAPQSVKMAVFHELYLSIYLSWADLKSLFAIMHNVWMEIEWLWSGATGPCVLTVYCILLLWIIDTNNP